MFHVVTAPACSAGSFLIICASPLPTRPPLAIVSCGWPGGGAGWRRLSGKMPGRCRLPVKRTRI